MTAATRVYVVATTARPTIVCPEWCDVSEGQHISDLPAWGGYVVHQWQVGVSGNADEDPVQFELSAGVSLCPDGTPAPDPRNALSITIEGRDHTPAQALAIAEDIKALVDEVTSEVAVP